MLGDCGCVSSWDCCVSDKQSTWQQTLQQRVCDRASRNRSVFFLNSSGFLDGILVFLTTHLCSQKDENGVCLELKQAGRPGEWPRDWWWDFHASGKECRDALLARQEGSTASMHCEGDPVGGNWEDDVACVSKSGLDWSQYHLFVLSLNPLLGCGHQMCVHLVFWGWKQLFEVRVQ